MKLMECFAYLAIIGIILHAHFAIQIVELVMEAVIVHVFLVLLLLSLYFLKISYF